MKSSMRFVFLLSLLPFVFSITIGLSQDFTSDDCMLCHGDEELTTVVDDSIEVSLYVDIDKFSNSVHGGFECLDCHYNIEELPHDEELEHPNCNECHDDVAEEYATSIHGISLQKGIKDAPYCWDCHTSHYVYSTDDTMSSMHILNQPETCAICHSDPRIVKKFHIPIANPSEVYESSVHFKAVLQDSNFNAASCADCHGAHDLRLPSDPDSKINRFNIPRTCSNCHKKIYNEYIESVHGVGLLAGASDSPVCTDCHSEHAIKEHTDPNSTVYTTVVSRKLCPECHEAERIVSKYGMNPNVVESYKDSYHGLAIRGGGVVSANCASCHGVHNIRLSTDPQSKIHKNNLSKTCGECHPGVTDKVTQGSVHIYATPESDVIIYYVTIAYYILIFTVIGGMVFHNGLDFIKKFKNKLQNGTGDHIEEFSGRVFVRLSLNERIQHFLLMASFILLVITGFAMKYPEAWWVAPFAKLEGAFVLRGFVHRIAAVVMIALSFYHLYYLIATRRGRGHLLALLPTVKDLTDVIDMFKYYFGLAKEKPKFERYNYIEKAEYWALIWGTVVMSLTGFILWFENLSLKYFPKWITDVSTVIHFYEALLATLAILVWHFYFQFFDPHVYPMNTTCITGKMSEKNMKEEHPLEYERLENDDE